MPRTHGYAPIGKRCFGKHDWVAKGRTNVIGALLNGLLLTVSLFQSNIDSLIFSAWLKEDLIPKLSKASVVIMDNASFHKSSCMKKALKESGHELLYLPKYSPDLNPIEQKWSQLKRKRKLENASVEELFKTTGRDTFKQV